MQVDNKALRIRDNKSLRRNVFRRSRIGVSCDPSVNITLQCSLDVTWLLALTIEIGLLIQIVLNHLSLLDVLVLHIGTSHLRLHQLLR